MPSISQSTTAILELLLAITGSAYMRVHRYVNGSCSRIDYPPGNPEQITELKDVSERFSTASCIHYQHLQFEFSIITDSHVQVAFQNAHSLDSQHNNRRSIVTDLHHNKWLVDFYRKNDFSDEFLELTNATDARTYLPFFCAMVALVNNHELLLQYQHLSQDTLTQLATKSALYCAIEQNIERGNVALCLIHCRDFQQVNRKFGQSKGDIAIKEIAHVIKGQTRIDDIVCRLGGALFGIASFANSAVDGMAIANKIQHRLHSKPYLHNSIRLEFNIGIAFIGKPDVKTHNQSIPSMLITRAEQALRAAQFSDTPSIELWEEGKFEHEMQDMHHLSGIFTPDNVTNYRNMLLLWDITTIIADEPSFSKLVVDVIHRLSVTFDFSFGGITLNQESDLIVAVADDAKIHMPDPTTFVFGQQLQALRHKAISLNRSVQEHVGQLRFLLIPLDDIDQGCFFIVGDPSRLTLTDDLIMLFSGFARQLGKALKRNLLEKRLNQQLEQQNAQLTKKIKELQSGLKSDSLIFRSDVMQQLLAKAQRAAKTDTTVLITGESGTGKEKLIKAIHSFSDRHQHPLVIVDCGVIPETLIESELFGHVKGAFTGAQNEKQGKIQQADKGILVLDEIGELPLSMQPKLLRFVQEKSYTPVGGTGCRSVDVKIIAVTNRDLFAEVSAGRFRKDLYYRLHVVHLHTPPLRQRATDIDVLCQHFLHKFSHQFNIGKKFVSARTIDKLQRHRWPGNVRELENLLMQACLLSQSEEITFEELNVVEHVHTATFQEEKPHQLPSPLHNNPFMHDEPGSSSNNFDTHLGASEVTLEPITVHTDEHWRSRTQTALNRFVTDINRSLVHNNLNIGELIESYIFRKLQQKMRSNRHVAEKLKIPISTARRKLQKHQVANIPTTLPDSWNELSRLLDVLASNAMPVSEPLQIIKQQLVGAVLSEVKQNMTRAASLIGVSEPTLYKLKRTLYDPQLN